MAASCGGEASAAFKMEVTSERREAAAAAVALEASALEAEAAKLLISSGLQSVAPLGASGASGAYTAPNQLEKKEKRTL